MSEYVHIRDTNFSATLETALKQLAEALTRRWREQAARAIELNQALPMVPTPDVTGYQRRHLGREWYEPAWSYATLPARAHVDGGACRYLAWVHGGQNGDLSWVRCDGSITEAMAIDPRTGSYVAMPPAIDCGVGRILRQVEEWAWAERSKVFAALPLFDHHDVLEIEHAYRAYAAMERLLVSGEQPTSGPDRRSFSTRSAATLPQAVDEIAGHGGGWIAEWTGLAAESFHTGFGASVRPTLDHHLGIARVLGGLYRARAAIIEKGRREALYRITAATVALDARVTVISDPTPGLRAIQGIGLLIAPLGAPKAGGFLLLTWFLGDVFHQLGLLPTSERETHRHEPQEALDELHEEVGALNRELNKLESELHEEVLRLRETIHGLHSYHLELYDLTLNNPVGVAGTRTTAVEPDAVEELAWHCAAAAEDYETLQGLLKRTADADSHLADRDGLATRADAAVLEVRDQLHSFLRTTCARYHLAGEQLKAAARAYREVDADQQRILDSKLAALEARSSIDIDRWATATERSYDPFEGHPARAGAEPGWAQTDEPYIVEGDQHDGS
jgi:hypothetical protein